MLGFLNWFFENPARLLLLGGPLLSWFFAHAEQPLGRGGPHGGGFVAMFGIFICFVYCLITAIVGAVFAGISSGWVMAVLAFFGYGLLQFMLSCYVIIRKLQSM